MRPRLFAAALLAAACAPAATPSKATSRSTAAATPPPAIEFRVVRESVPVAADDGTLVFEGVELKVSAAHRFEVAHALASYDAMGWPAVSFTVTDEPGFADWSRENVGRSVVACVGGKPVSKFALRSPLVATALLAASTGHWSDADVAALVSQLQPASK